MNFKKLSLVFLRKTKVTLTCLILVTGAFTTYSQVIPTKGKEFWIAFPQNVQIQTYQKRCDIFVASEYNTSGVLSIPNQGWSLPFTVVAGQTTTLTIPFALVEHYNSEIIENKGVQVTTLDTVSVFAISFQEYSADATIVYPKQTLGTKYRITTYVASSNYPVAYNPEFIIVATEDNTQVKITPNAPTAGGHPAYVPFIVNLNKGESYQVLSQNTSNDLTGTLIEGTDSSGTCRPFAVFSGMGCVNIPGNCPACDILYAQSLPVSNWGKTFYAVPFSFANTYTLRVLADQPNTIFSMNGGATVTLNAGEFVEYNHITGTECITSSNPVNVIQYMEGASCAGDGDPSMIYLNSQDQKIDHAIFSTVTSNVITQHGATVIMNSTHINQLKLDGVLVPLSSFNTLSSCSNVSYAYLTLTQGSHTLEADSGFTAYIYGTGAFESYGYSAGSFSKFQPVVFDSVLCSTDTLVIGTNQVVFDPWWSTLTNPNDTLGTGLMLTLVPPIIADIYVLNAHEFISGCDLTNYYKVDVPLAPQTTISASASSACINQQVQLFAGTNPPSSAYIYTWTPGTGLNNPNIPNPTLTVTASGWYRVKISSGTACTNSVYDSIYITLIPFSATPLNVLNNQVICNGDSATLTAYSGGVSYQWNPTGNSSSIITIAPDVTTSYIVYITDINGCINSDTAIVFVNPLPPENSVTDIIACKGSAVNLTAAPGNSYLWSPTGATAASITVLAMNTSTYTVTLTNAFGCTVIDSAVVYVPDILFGFAGDNQVICTGYHATLSSSAGNSWLWTPGNVITPVNVVSPLVTTNYYLMITDTNGCPSYDTVQVAVMPFLGGSVRSDSICYGDSITLNASQGISCNWTPGGSTLDSITISPVANTSYIAQVMTSAGCNIYDTIFIIVNPIPVVDFGISNGCTSTGLEFHDLTYLMPPSPVPLQWMWDFGDGTNSTIQHALHIYNDPGMYDIGLTVITADGCEGERIKQQAMEIYQSPIAEFTCNPHTASILTPHITFTNQSIDAQQWFWNFGDGYSTSADYNAMHVYSDTGAFIPRLIVRNDMGCEDTAYCSVYIEPFFTFYLPTAFTPNDDGKNDLFMPLGDGIKEFNMIIYDRWGGKIFESSSITQPWDGTNSKDELKCSPGTYVYFIKLTDYTNKLHELSGMISLLK